MFISFSLNSGNHIDLKGTSKLSEALKSNTTLTSLNLGCMELVACWFSLNSDNALRDKGAIKLFEALQSNSSLVSLYLARNKT
jgi:hypothetical protein